MAIDNILLKNVHKNLATPCENGTSYVIEGVYEYYHYRCDGIIDDGWGCGYRTLQTICSWIKNTNKEQTLKPTPTICEIQSCLISLEDKPCNFMGSRQWIGTFEACLVLGKMYSIDCKIIHINNGKQLKDNSEIIKLHFQKNGGPIMMGGNLDCGSKAIVGIHMTDKNSFLLIIDPHYSGKPKSVEQLQNDSWVKWYNLSEFNDNSFYNLCIPQLYINN